MKENEILISENFSVDVASDFKEKIYELIDNGEKRFLLNFKNCTFIDSTGLGVLVGIHKKCTEIGGSLVLSSIVDPKVLKIFKLTRLDRIFNIE